MFVRLDCFPILRGTELDIALPLRELSTSNLFPNNDVDFSPAQRLRVHEGRAPLGAVREVVGIGRSAFSGGMKVSFQAARSIG